YMPPSTLKTRAASCLNGHRPEGTAFLEMRPDPQTYSLEPPIAEPSGQSFTGARRWNSQPQISYIGPGTYRTEIPATIKGVVKMSSVQRFAENDPDDICPGPGAYHPESASRRGGGNQTTFARAPRQEPPKEFSHLAGERRDASAKRKVLSTCQSVRQNTKAPAAFSIVLNHQEFQRRVS
ncbi:unnamed protein product, partial [Durusdinium trenchii]